MGSISTYAERKEKVNAKALPSDCWCLDLEDIEKGGRLLVRTTIDERSSIGDKTLFRKGYVLYSKLRPYLLKVLVAQDDGVCSPEIVPFSLYGSVNPYYIANVLKSPYVDSHINAITYGIKMPRVGTDTMVNLLIPLPPIHEQDRIIKEIQSLFSICELL